MDQAILNSESEREVIHDRKKRRVTDIGSDCTCPLGDASEFRYIYVCICIYIHTHIYIFI
jgi:hypothetical protein